MEKDIYIKSEEQGGKGWVRVISTIRSVVRRDETRVGVEEGLKRFVEAPYIFLPWG